MIIEPFSRIPFSDAVFFQEGPGVRSYEFQPSGTPLMNIRLMQENGLLDLKDCRLVSNETASTKWKHFMLDPDDIVLASSGSLGKKAWVRENDLPLMLNTSVIRLRPQCSKTLDRKFLWHYLGTRDFSNQFLRLKTGTAQFNFGPSHLKQMTIPLPPLDEQRRIAAILDKADAVRRKRQRAIEKSEEFLRSVFLDMFGDPVRNSKEWPTNTFQELAKIQRGKFTPRPRNDPSYYNGEYPFIQTGDISSVDGYLKKWHQTLNEKGTKVSQSFEPGTVVIAIVGATIGATAILGKCMYCPDSVVGIQCRKGFLKPEYVEYTLRFWKPIFLARAPATARANINLETLRPLNLPHPPIELQQNFSEIYKRILLRPKKTEIEKRLFNSLVQRAFRGEL